MIKTFRKLLDLLAPHERRRAVLLLGMILVMAFLEVGGVASIVPFMAVLANPEVIETNAILARIYDMFGFTDRQAFLHFTGVMVFMALLVSITFKALVTYVQLRFTMMREYSIGRRLVAGYLNQPYAWFLNRHSADLGKTVLSEVNKVIGGAMIPMMQLVAQSAVVLMLLMLLLAADPWLALVVGGVLGLAYGVILKLMRGYLSRIGSECLEANKMRFTVVSEAFGGIKEIKVGGLEESYIQRFARPAKIFAGHQASSQIIAQLPRFVLEALAFGSMVLVVLYIMAGTGGIAKALPIIALYAFAGYRLMPALQQIYVSITALRFAGPSLNALHADLIALAPKQPSYVQVAQFILNQAITLKEITYTYPNAAQPALVDLNITIPARSTIGLVGTTGSGKTTTVDLILGLLDPSSGTLAVDGTVIGPENRRQWQRVIGYVPQHIYLADDTVAANIAFGVAPEQIDQNAVANAARIANLHDFVTNELPHGYATTVGERGVRLSGGQRQRIGIARALYNNPQVLILDEATSALDNLTEQAVMDAVHNLGKKVTIILIAHRLTTVRECDQIYLLRHGRVVGQGRHDELMEENETFRAMKAR
ncbi:MAG: ABC transporter ATP-binding protein [Nitrospirota bacterium]|nr:ABC transporter ATP-binding protein [Nitrospirota bacterium]